MTNLDFMEAADNPAGQLDSILQKVRSDLISSISYDDYNRTNPRMRGAELASACPRINTFRLHDKGDRDNGLTGYNCLTAHSGKAIEQLMRRNLIKMYPEMIVLWDEFIPKTSKMGLNYSGKLDFLFDIPGLGLTVVDIKTTQRISDEKRVDMKDIKYALETTDSKDELLDILNKSKGGIRKSSAQVDKYLEQVVGYATLLDIDHAIVFIVSRSKENFFEDITTEIEYVEVTEAMKIETVAKMLFAQRLADQYALANRPKKFKKSKECQYCDFQTECWDETHDFNVLSKKDEEVFWKECLDEAKTLYNQHRGTLRWIRDKKIDEAKIIKEAFTNPNEKTIAAALEIAQINIYELLNVVIPHFDMQDTKQVEFNVKTYW